MCLGAPAALNVRAPGRAVQPYGGQIRIGLIWVPQDPRAWARPKLVFRDIAAEPAFWLELDPAVVNGDCYWLAAR